jgi:hypothetical protein
MFMIAGLLLLGVLSLGLVLYWYKKVIQLNSFISPLLNRLGKPDISGNRHYTDCDSHKWVMKNVVYGDYLKSAEGFRNFMMNRTMTGTLILGIILGLIPVIAVYLLFQSYQLIGTSLILVILSVYIVRGPGELEISDQLFQWQTEQDCDKFTLGDLAYSEISKKTIMNWIRKLLAIGTICIILAPWGESIFPALAYAFALFVGVAYANIYVPISIYSMPLALMLFFVAGPLVLSIGIIGIRSMYRKTKKDGENFNF